MADLAFSPLAIGSGGRGGRSTGGGTAKEQRRSGRLAKLARRAAACLGIGGARTSPMTPAVRRASSVADAAAGVASAQPMAVDVGQSYDGCRIPDAIYQRVAIGAGPLAAEAASASWALPPSTAAADGDMSAMQHTPTAAAAVATRQLSGLTPGRTRRACSPADALAAETARKRGAAARRGRRKSNLPRSGGSAGRRSSGAWSAATFHANN